MIHARFHLQTITLRSHPHAGAEFSAITRGEANRAWAKLTPTGKLVLGSLDEPEVDWLIAQRTARTDDQPYGAEFDLFLSRDAVDGQIVRHIELMGLEREQYEPTNGGQVKFQSLHGDPFVEWTMKIAAGGAWDAIAAAWLHDQTEWWLAIRR